MNYMIVQCAERNADFDLRVLEIHKQHKSDGKSRIDAWDYLDNLKWFNIMNVGWPVFDMIDNLWSE